MKMDQKKQVSVFQTRQLETEGNCPVSKVQKSSLQFHSAQFQSSFEVPGLIHLTGCFLTKRPRWWCIIAKVLLPSNKQTTPHFWVAWQTSSILVNLTVCVCVCVCGGKAWSWAETCFYFVKLSPLKSFWQRMKTPFSFRLQNGDEPTPLSHQNWGALFCIHLPCMLAMFISLKCRLLGTKSQHLWLCFHNIQM